MFFKRARELENFCKLIGFSLNSLNTKDLTCVAFDSFNRSGQILIKIKSCHSVFRLLLQKLKLSESVECVWILVVVCEDIWTNLWTFCGLSITICGHFVDFLWTMASDQSPPGRPGFKIRPLKPLAEVPSGRRLMWLTQHDSKYKFKLKKISVIAIQRQTFNAYIRRIHIGDRQADA